MQRAALATLLAAGVVVRAWSLVTWRPAFIGYYDTAPYVGAARGALFSDPFRPAGYPGALRLLHALSDRVTAVTVVQHALGVATALLLYGALRGVARNAWWALLAPAVVLLDGFQVLMEHAVLSDTLFVFLLTGALYAALRARRGPLRWAIAAGALIASAATVRTVGLFVVPVVPAALLSRSRMGLIRLAAAAAATAAVLVAYLHAGSISQAPGWSLYARVGQFADCTRFRAPAGTRRLCETSAPAARQSTDFYYWSPHSPAQRAFGAPPAGDRLVGAFAHAAIRAQPLGYLSTVAHDFARYVAPGSFRRPRAGETQEQYLSQAQRPNELRFLGGELRTYYRGVGAARRDGAALTIGYVRATLVRGPLMALLLVLAAVAPLVTRGDRRVAAALLAVTAFVLLLVPVATQVYDARYALAALGPLSAAAALALDAIPLRRPSRALPTRRWRASRIGRRPGAGSPSA
jgi:hypothetical protein